MVPTHSQPGVPMEGIAMAVIQLRAKEMGVLNMRRNFMREDAELLFVPHSVSIKAMKLRCLLWCKGGRSSQG